MNTVIGGDAGNSMSGGHVDGDLNQFFIKILRDAFTAKALNAETVARLQKVHIPTEQSANARPILEQQGAVALVGEVGTGRRITGIALLANLGLNPHIVTLDPEDLRRSLDVEGGHGYLLDLDEAQGQLTPTVGHWIADLATNVRREGARLVVRSTVLEWRSLAIEDHIIRAVPITPPSPQTIFISHLTSLVDEYAAKNWARNEPLIERLGHARPADAVRLARLVRDVHAAGVPEPRQLSEVLAAYADWADELTQWFHATAEPKEGHRRAMLLASAALSGAPAATVFEAAELLGELSGLERPPGGALIGPDIQTLVRDIGADLSDGHVLFTRPNYPESVLDHVWRERPHLRRVLRKWLSELPRTRDRATVRAAQSLTALAVRQHDASLVTEASMKWAQESGLRDVAVGALTAAALSEQIGRTVRRRLREWAQKETVAEEVHLTIAQVCEGPLAQAYPRIVLTRLRHLAVRKSDRVKDATVDALATLAGDRRLRGAVLRELAEWVAGEDLRRTVGRRAFLRLADMRDDDGRLVLLPGSADSDQISLVELWRDVLRHPDPEGAGADTAMAWLETAAQAETSWKAIIELFTSSIRTSVDLGNLTKIAATWHRTRTVPSAIPRDEIFLLLVRLASERDPLNTDIRLRVPEES